MQIEVDDNPNTRGGGQFVFQELEAAKTIVGIHADWRGQEVECDLVGVDEGGVWVQAYAQKIADSGAGFAFLITGGAWGVRIKPRIFASEVWNLESKNQWGEPFKIYGEEKDLIYGNR
jgi:hypothetical protein